MAYIEQCCSHCGKSTKFSIVQVVNRLAECTVYHCQCRTCLKGEIIIVENDIYNSPPVKYPSGLMIEDKVPSPASTKNPFD